MWHTVFHVFGPTASARRSVTATMEPCSCCGLSVALWLQGLKPNVAVLKWEALKPTGSSEIHLTVLAVLKSVNTPNSQMGSHSWGGQRVVGKVGHSLWQAWSLLKLMAQFCPYLHLKSIRWSVTYSSQRDADKTWLSGFCRESSEIHLSLETSWQSRKRGLI